MTKFYSIKTIAFLFAILLSTVFCFYTLHLPSYALHQVGTVIMLLILLYYNHKITLSNTSFILYCLFLYLHIIASCWLYSFVPYNDWSVALFSFDIHGYFGWQRNMFDRLVHFCYGLLLYPLFFDVIKHYFKPLSTNKIHAIVLLWVMASSMMYELIEWWIALGLSPQDAENYNGQQGDVWDAHKDMFLASLGSVLAIGSYQIKFKPITNL